ncbi:MAG: hypothetical protein CMM30_00645 [Rhodospirillaceae bacterium]|nr:hypothetical protein [Rhodospirillaceae bacterium]|tara:strand:- start:2869 stop:3312 length:444 start_codon:yes stop_codon:yes gene_type:complete
MDSIRILIKINPIYLLGWAGLIPFWGLTIVSHCNNDYANFATQLQVFYGAVILSFLGGIHWGIPILRERSSHQKHLYWGVVPSLIGWLALALPTTWTIIILAIGFIISFLVDVWFFSASSYYWYKQTRFFLTIMVVLALLINLASIY